MSNLSAAAGDLRPETSRGRSFTIGRAEPVGLTRPAWLASAVLGFACFMAVVALLAGVWAERGRGVRPAEPVPVAPSPEPPAVRWIDITRPLPMFDLAGGPYARLPMRLEAHRETDGSARQDVLTYGVPQPGEAFVRILFDRHDPGPAGETTLFVDAARLAGTAGLAVLRSGNASSLATRFGGFEVAEVTLGRSDRNAPCTAFRHEADILAIVGLMCGAGAKAVDTASLACSLDKLDLVIGDVALRDLFNAAERQRGLGCSDSRASHGPVDPLRPISSALRGTLAGPQALDRQLSGLR